MKTPAAITTCVLLVACMAAHARTWTDTTGRELEANFVSATEQAVTVRRSTDGKVFEIPLERLSEADRAFVSEQLQTGGESDASETGQDQTAGAGDGFPADGLVWPRRTSLPDDYDVEVIKEDNEISEYIYRTPHFEFRSNVKLQRKVVREFGKIFEGTFESVKAMPLRWAPQTPEGRYLCRLYETKEEYIGAGGIRNAAGSYHSGTREIRLPVTSLGVKRSSSGFTLESKDADHTTLIHEITHQVQHEWLYRMPIWLSEGVAVFSENIPYRKGEFRYDRMDLNDMLEARSGNGEEITMVRLERLMNITPQEWNKDVEKGDFSVTDNYASSFVLFYYFTFLDGEGDGRPMYELLRALENGTPQEKVADILLAGRSYEELEEDLRKALRRERVKVSFN